MAHHSTKFTWKTEKNNHPNPILQLQFLFSSLCYSSLSFLLFLNTSFHHPFPALKRLLHFSKFPVLSKHFLSSSFCTSSPMPQIVLKTFYREFTRPNPNPPPPSDGGHNNKRRRHGPVLDINLLEVCCSDPNTLSHKPTPIHIQVHGKEQTAKNSWISDTGDTKIRT